MVELEFFTTAGCHLCEEAEVLLQALVAQESVSVEVIDIAISEDLVELYGLRIPVVKNPTLDKEIGWPFDYSGLLNLI